MFPSIPSRLDTVTPWRVHQQSHINEIIVGVGIHKPASVGGMPVSADCLELSGEVPESVCNGVDNLPAGLSVSECADTKSKSLDNKSSDIDSSVAFPRGNTLRNQSNHVTDSKIIFSSYRKSINQNESGSYENRNRDNLVESYPENLQNKDRPRHTKIGTLNKGWTGKTISQEHSENRNTTVSASDGSLRWNSVSTITRIPLLSSTASCKTSHVNGWHKGFNNNKPSDTQPLRTDNTFSVLSLKSLQPPLSLRAPNSRMERESVVIDQEIFEEKGARGRPRLNDMPNNYHQSPLYNRFNECSIRLVPTSGSDDVVPEIAQTNEYSVDGKLKSHETVFSPISKQNSHRAYSATKSVRDSHSHDVRYFPDNSIRSKSSSTVVSRASLNRRICSGVTGGSRRKEIAPESWRHKGIDIDEHCFRVTQLVSSSADRSLTLSHAFSA